MRQYPPEFRAKVVKYYADHPDETGQGIAKRFGLSTDSVRRWLKAAGVHIRPLRKPPIPTGEFLAAWNNNGQRRRATAEALGVGQERLDRKLDELGIWYEKTVTGFQVNVEGPTCDKCGYLLLEGDPVWGGPPSGPHWLCQELLAGPHNGKTVFLDALDYL